MPITPYLQMSLDTILMMNKSYICRISRKPLLQTPHKAKESDPFVSSEAARRGKTAKLAVKAGCERE